MDSVLVVALIAFVGTGIAAAVAWRRLRAEAADLAEAPLQTAPPPSVGEPGPAPLAPEDGMDWLAQAADELRTPLSVLRGQVEALRQNIDAASRHTLLTVAERLVNQVDNLEGLVEAWSVSAHINEDQRPSAARPVELVALARSLCARLTKLDEPPFDVADGPPLWALLDLATLEHALGVLLRSARRAAPFGLIEVVARAIGAGSGLRICFSVADRRAAIRGHGNDIWQDLELDLVRVLVEDCGGWLELEDRAGGGAITTLWLPGRLIIPISGAYAAWRDTPPPQRGAA